MAIVGLDDGGTPVGLKVDDTLLRSLSDMRSDGSTLPLPTMTVERRQVLGKEVAVVTVVPADAPPVKYKGRTYIRVRPRRAIADRQEERVLGERRRFKDLPFDLRPVGSAQLVELGRRLFEEECLPAAVAPDILAANERTYEERLAATRMISGITGSTPTLLGILVLAIRPRDFVPGAYVQFLRIDGKELGDPIVDEEAIDGPLAQQLRRLDEKLRSHVRSGRRHRQRSDRGPDPRLSDRGARSAGPQRGHASHLRGDPRARARQLVQRVEEPPAARWLAGASGREPDAALPALSVFWQVARQAATVHDAEVVLLDIGPNLGAVSRT